MKGIGEAAAKAARHRKFHWCRRPNGFCDMPLWGVVADKLGMPLYQVVAFVNRLEELGNAAANFGDIRGNLARFNPEEFSKALGMPADDVARIYAALEHPDIGWIAYDHVADFYNRNPDREDETAAERQRRKRLRDAIRPKLAKLTRLGKIDERERVAIEEALGGSEAELRNLQAKLARAELSTEGDVTRDSRDVTRDIENADFSKGRSYPHVTRESRQSRAEKLSKSELSTEAVDNSADGARGAKDGLSMGTPGVALVEQATIWIDSTAKQMLVDFLQIRPALAETYIERWRRDLNDDVALAEIIQAADKVGYIGARFHTIITEQWKRHVLTKQHGPQLPLMPPRPHNRKESA